MRPTESEVAAAIAGKTEIEARDIWKAAFATNPKLISSPSFIAWLMAQKKAREI